MKQDSEPGDYERFIRPYWSADEVENLKVVAGFLRILRSKDFDRLLSEYGHHPYVQHNIGMEDGVPGVIKEGRKAAKHFPDFSIDPMHVYVDGASVVIHSHMTAKPSHRGDDGKGLNVIDIWKVSDGEIVEHWDSIQPLDFGGRLLSLFTGAATRNRNRRF